VFAEHLEHPEYPPLIFALPSISTDRFVTFRTRTFQLEILKNLSSVNFKTHLSSFCSRFTSTPCWVVWEGCCGG